MVIPTKIVLKYSACLHSKWVNVQYVCMSEAEKPGAMRTNSVLLLCAVWLLLGFRAAGSKTIQGSVFPLLWVQNAFIEKPESHTHKGMPAHRQQQLEDLPLEQLEPPQPGSHWQVLGAMQRPWTQLSAQWAGHGGERKRQGGSEHFHTLQHRYLH